jgi:hypothetical protein
MNTIFGLVIILFFIGALISIYKSIANPEHDFFGDLEKEKETYQYSIFKCIDDIKSFFQ